MDEPHDQDKNDHAREQAGSDAAKAADGGSADNLPMVDSPELGGEDAVDEQAAETRQRYGKAGSASTLPALFSEPARDARGNCSAASDAPSRSLRFALLAATIAGAAGIGALIGSLSASGIGGERTAAIQKPADTHDVLQALRTERSELSALRASLDSANRSAGTQFAKLSDRLNSLERAQADPSAKLARIADEVERLERRTGISPDITGSIAAPASAPAPVAKPPVLLHDWIVQDVRNGRAMVENRFGAYFLVGSGSVMPGLGRVQDVKRQNGAWIVVTEKGLISSNP